jgi:hypothetical protein
MQWLDPTPRFTSRDSSTHCEESRQQKQVSDASHTVTPRGVRPAAIYTPGCLSGQWFSVRSFASDVVKP